MTKMGLSGNDRKDAVQKRLQAKLRKQMEKSEKDGAVAEPAQQNVLAVEAKDNVPLGNSTNIL